VARPSTVPITLRHAPFRGSVAVARGLLTARQLAGPGWRRLFRDVYVSADTPVDHYTMCRAAALLLPPGAALSHRSAALLCGVDVLDRNQRVEVTNSAGSRHPGLRVHRSPLGPGDTWERGGLPVTSPLRTAFDLARDSDPVAAVAGLDALLNRRAITLPRLGEYLADHPHWSGLRRARRALALARYGVESPMETRLRLTVVLGGLPEPEAQCEVFDTAGHFVARLDLAYRKRRVGLEYDGDHHRERATFQRDAVRLNRLRLLGWTVLRFTADDVLRHPDRVVAQVRAALTSCGPTNINRP
jgi:hypothetical protein